MRKIGWLGFAAAVVSLASAAPAMAQEYSGGGAPYYRYDTQTDPCAQLDARHEAQHEQIAFLENAVLAEQQRAYATGDFSRLRAMQQGLATAESREQQTEAQLAACRNTPYPYDNGYYDDGYGYYQEPPYVAPPPPPAPYVAPRRSHRRWHWHW